MFEKKEKEKKKKDIVNLPIIRLIDPLHAVVISVSFLNITKWFLYILLNRDFKAFLSTSFFVLI